MQLASHASMSYPYAHAESVIVSNFLAKNHYMQGIVFPLKTINRNNMKTLISVYTKSHPTLKRQDQLSPHHLLAIAVLDSIPQAWFRYPGWLARGTILLGMAENKWCNMKGIRVCECRIWLEFFSMVSHENNRTLVSIHNIRDLISQGIWKVYSLWRI